MSCSSNSNKVARAACRLGISSQANKYAFYAGAAAAVGIGAALLVRTIKNTIGRRQTTRAWVAAYNAAADEINQLLREAGPTPEGEHTRYHFFGQDGHYAGWTHSEKVAPKIAALNGYSVMSATSTKTETEVTKDFSSGGTYGLAQRGLLVSDQAAAKAVSP